MFCTFLDPSGTLGFFDLGVTRKGGFFGWESSPSRKSGSRSPCGMPAGTRIRPPAEFPLRQIPRRLPAEPCGFSSENTVVRDSCSGSFPVRRGARPRTASRRVVSGRACQRERLISEPSAFTLVNRSGHSRPRSRTPRGRFQEWLGRTGPPCTPPSARPGSSTASASATRHRYQASQPAARR